MGFHQFEQPIFLSNNLITGYSSLGELQTCRKVFDEMPERNTVSYNSMITAYVRNEKETGAWELFVKMMGLGIIPTQYTFGSLLSSLSLELVQGFQLHSLILKNGLLYSNAYSGTSLLGLYGRLGCLVEVMKLFDEMPYKNLVTANSIISSFGHHGFVEESMIMFIELLRASVSPSERSFVGVLSGFEGLRYLDAGKQIHGMVLKTGSEFYTSVSNSLINMYVQCSDILLAEKVFKLMPSRDIVSWNTVIGAFAKSFDPGKALELFLTMPLHGFTQNQATFASVISSCSSLHILKCGERVHAKAIKINIHSDVIVGSALIDFYSKCNCLEQADVVFIELRTKNVISWNALIAGYSNKDSRASFSLLQQMLHEDYRPNEFSFSAVLKSSMTQNLQLLHCLILKMGYHQYDYISSSLISSYMDNGLPSHALSFAGDSMYSLSTVSSNIIAGIHNRRGQYEKTQKLLFQVEEFDKVSWNTLITACTRCGEYREALELFKSMQLARVSPDNCTLVSLLSISTKLCNLELGSSIHGRMIRTDFNCCDVFVCNVLVDMYSKCGSIESSVKVFNEMTQRNLISWTTLISGLGLHGYPSMALESFREMELLGFKPDRVAFIAILSACRHGGLVEDGMELFGRMKGCYNIEPEMDHYVCLVDMLTRYGHLKEAEQLISDMPLQPNAAIWRTFVQGCRRYNSILEASR
ncbi:hypothetical protein AQUCO_00300775v1 [Aquilegia coerulea]|uniref:Pentacotripeptide-repeat region of PRORP domain-containing protein n=1 Tax=Aquilegia coerulea TaxID=218851 RepID=A0A2G5F0G7_AQUCA|nr:hypothetical protein AQUCO_00300775v1 [Aquilegia coerulea]